MSSEKGGGTDLAEPFPYLASNDVGAARGNGKAGDAGGTAPLWFGNGQFGPEDRERKALERGIQEGEARGRRSKRSWRRREARLRRRSRRSRESASRISRASSRKWCSSRWPLPARFCTAKPKWIRCCLWAWCMSRWRNWIRERG